MPYHSIEIVELRDTVILIATPPPLAIILQHSLESSVKRTVMDVQKSSALMEWSAWTSRPLVWGLSVELALLDTQEIHRNVMVS